MMRWLGRFAGQAKCRPGAARDGFLLDRLGVHAFPLLMAIALASGPAAADVTHVTGSLNDPSDPLVVGPGTNAADAAFDSLDPGVSINNVVLFALSLPGAGNVNFQSRGADADFIDPYLSIFAGTGDLATFLFSTFAGAFGDLIDVTLSLVAGDYTVALSAFLNMSFAENLGAGSLGDGFIRLGIFSGGVAYDLAIDTGVVAAPEPSSLTLLVVALAAVVVCEVARHPRRPKNV